MGILAGLFDMVWLVLTGLFGDLLRAVSSWAKAHPSLAAMITFGWFGVGKLGAAKALLPRRSSTLLVVLAGPPLLVWALLRKTKSGRRGLVVAAPVVAGLLIVGMWVYSPESRKVWVAGFGLALLVYLATTFDEWLGGKPWTVASVREALARDDAHHAIRTGVQAVTPGASVAKPKRSGSAWASGVSMPAGASPGTLDVAAENGTLGTAASASGVLLSEVSVNRGPAGAQGRVVVVGTVAGQPNPLDASFEYPHAGRS